MANAEDQLENEDRPWETPGAVRRDCEPHRAHLVRLIGTISLICGLLSICFGLTGPVGILAGIAAWLMARCDLRKMSEGIMDPSGRTATRLGKECGQLGIAFSMLCGAWPAAIVLSRWLR